MEGIAYDLQMPLRTLEAKLPPVNGFTFLIIVSYLPSLTPAAVYLACSALL